GAAEERCGLGSGIDDERAVLDDGGECVDVLDAQTLVTRLPAMAVGAPEDAVAMRAGKDAFPAARQHRHRADVMLFQRGCGELPWRAAFFALEDFDAGRGGDNELGGRRAAVKAALTIRRENGFHGKPPPGLPAILRPRRAWPQAPWG